MAFKWVETIDRTEQLQQNAKHKNEDVIFTDEQHARRTKHIYSRSFFSRWCFLLLLLL